MPELPLVAVLRSGVKTPRIETSTATLSSARDSGKRVPSPTGSVTPASAIPSESIATTPPQAEPGAMDVNEAGKSYLFALAREMRRAKRAPDAAGSHAGTSEIRVAIASGGSVAPPELLKSSGYPDLDQAALAMVGAALQRASVPAGLFGEAFELILPISFDPAD